MIHHAYRPHPCGDSTEFTAHAPMHHVFFYLKHTYASRSSKFFVIYINIMDLRKERKRSLKVREAEIERIEATKKRQSVVL